MHPIFREFRCEDDWSYYCRTAAGLDYALVCCVRLTHSGVGRLTELRILCPSTPILVITQRSAERLRMICQIVVEQVVWLDEIDERLESHVQRAMRLSTMQRLHARMSGLQDCPEKLRCALELATRPNHPVFKVARLAEITDCDRRTLWRQWRDWLGPESDLHLRELLAWLQLLQAVCLKTPLRPWRRVADRVGISLRTLHRRAAHLTGRTLSDLEALGPDWVIDRFRRQLDADGEPLHATIL